MYVKRKKCRVCKIKTTMYIKQIIINVTEKKNMKGTEYNLNLVYFKLIFLTIIFNPYLSTDC